MRILGEPTGRQGKDPKRAENKLRSAILSVYYQSVGRQFEVRGAPSVMLPPEVQPMSLGESLKVISPSPTRLKEALWRIVQSVPLDMTTNSERPFGRYPAAIVPYLRDRDLDLTVLDDLRQQYRSGSNLFTAALIACRDQELDTARALAKLLAGTGQGSRSYTDAIQELLGVSAKSYLEELADTIHPDSVREAEVDRAAAKAVSKQIAKIETEVGCSIQQFVESLADVAAFQQFIGDNFDPIVPREYTMFPVCSVIRQNTRSLTTSATVTTIVKGEYGRLIDAINPANWSRSSDIIKKSVYIADPFDLKPAASQVPFGMNTTQEDGHEGPSLLEEKVEVTWDPGGKQQATYHNVLNILTTEHDGNADVDYNLCRSIDSSVLWDRRPGGLLVDQGYIKVRHLRGDYYRLTMRKEVRFADRTPYSNPSGWRDFGELTNYLAPATLSWWLESEMYSMADPVSASTHVAQDARDTQGVEILRRSARTGSRSVARPR